MLNLTPRFTEPCWLTYLKAYKIYIIPTLTRLFLARGVTNSEALDYGLSTLLPADGLKDIDQAVKILDTAIESQQRILL